MHLREGQFEKAHTDFFEAFKVCFSFRLSRQSAFFEDKTLAKRDWYGDLWLL